MAPKKSPPVEGNARANKAFDPDRLHERVQYLAYPRFPETPGARKVVTACRHEFEATGLAPRVEAFTYPRQFTNLVRVLTGLIAGVLVAYTLKDFHPILGGVFYGLLVAEGAYAVTFLVVSRDPRTRLPGRATSQNVWARVPARDPEARGVFVVSAHHDSKSQRLKMHYRALALRVGFQGGVIAAVFVVLDTILDAVVESGESFPGGGAIVATSVAWAARASVLVVAGGFLALALNKSGNRSPGAIDNASGMTVVFELARWFAAHPLAHHEAWFVQFGAEEVGRMGARAFVAAHAAEFREHTVYNLNFDLVARRPVQFMVRELGFRVPVAPTLEPVLWRVARAQGIEVRGLRSLGRNFTDRTVFTKAGHEALGFTDWSPGVGAVVHSPRDTPDAIDPAVLVDACRLAAGVMSEVDAGRL